MRFLIFLQSLLAAASIQAAPPAAEATPAATGSRVVSYNIKHGQGMDKKLDLHRTAETIRKLAPDLVALQEIDLNCGRSSGVDQMAALGAMLKMHHAFPSEAPEQEIDFILVPKGSPWEKITSQVIDDRLTSDHRPVLAVIPF